jgi:ubiquinone/menaquinone biosynthesis C-methylase UbiE
MIAQTRRDLRDHSQRNLEVFYQPNLRLSQATGFLGYNAGYAEGTGRGSFDQHQKDLVWRLLADVHIGPESTVVDVGCGIGGPSGWIFERYRPMRLVAIDFCHASVREAEGRWSKKPQRPVFLQGDAAGLPIQDASVDVIFNLESALHYSDKHAFIRECRRILKPGGVLCLGDICTRRRRLFAVLGLLNYLPTQFSTHARLWSPDQYVEAFGAAGLHIQRQEDVSRQSADSLRDGLAEISRAGWAAARGYRRRFFYLCAVERMLRREWLTYHLFNVMKP